MSNYIYRPKTKDFKIFDLTKQADANQLRERCDESFNNMKTMNKELERIAKFEGVYSRIVKNRLGI